MHAPRKNKLILYSKAKLGDHFSLNSPVHNFASRQECFPCLPFKRGENELGSYEVDDDDVFGRKALSEREIALTNDSYDVG